MLGIWGLPLLLFLWTAAWLGLIMPSVAAQSRGSVISPADTVSLRNALADIDAGRPEQAESTLRRLADRYPNDDRVNEALGLIYAETGEVNKAVPYLQRACSSAPQSAVNHANLGTAWLRLGQARDAAVELKMATRLAPRNADAFSKLGQAYMLLHDPAEAARVFSQAVALDPHNSDLLYNFAVALTENGETQRVSQVLDRIPQGEMSDQAESLAGEVEEKLGNYMAAVRHDQSAASKNPSETNLYALCVEFLRHWTWHEARQTAEYGIARYPDSQRMKLALGVALFGAKSFPEAAKVFAGLLRTDTNNSMYADILGRTCGEISGGNADCGAIEEFAKKHPENASAAYYAARQILQRPHSTADLSEARTLLQRATAARPPIAEAWYEMGVLDAETTHWQDSAEALKEAIALRPSFTAAHYQLSIAYAHLNRPADRRRELALFQTYSSHEKDEVNARVQQMTIFLTKPQ